MSVRPPFDRTTRVADAIFRLVSEMLVDGISDPRLAGVYLTRVRVTKDIHIARIYFHFEGADGEAIERAEGGFKSASGFIRSRIAEEIALKFTPELEFFYDEAQDAMERIEKLLGDEKKGAANG
jgi:ribosome-binding factor A